MRIHRLIRSSSEICSILNGCLVSACLNLIDHQNNLQLQENVHVTISNTVKLKLIDNYKVNKKGRNCLNSSNVLIYM